MNDRHEEIAAPRHRDAAEPYTSARLLAYLQVLGIRQQTFEHPPVYTVDEAKALRGDLPGAHSKNLFLRDKKGGMWLLTCLADRQINLRELGKLLGARSLSFASRERLWRYLGVIPGAVTPFAVINDRCRAVTVVLDRALLSFALLNFHPLDNAKTTAITPEALLRFLSAVEHEPRLVDL